MRTSWWLGAVTAGALGCGHDPPTPRERVLAALPAGASIIAVGDAGALRALPVLVDELRRHVPPSLQCTIDAALGASQAGAAVTHGGITIAIVADAAPTGCPALSRIDDGLWAATLGGGEVATRGAASALAGRGLSPTGSTAEGRRDSIDDDQLARARSFLRTAPIAVAASQPVNDLHLIATASPTEAWVSEDFATVASEDAFEQIHRKHGVVERNGAQLVIRARSGELATIVREVIQLLWQPPIVGARGMAARLGCPASRAVVQCALTANGLELTIADFGAVAGELDAAELVPVVASGQVSGVRVVGAAVASLGLAVGDVVIAVQGRPVPSVRELVDTLRGRGRTTLLVARGTTQLQIAIVPR